MDTDQFPSWKLTDWKTKIQVPLSQKRSCAGLQRVKVSATKGTSPGSKLLPFSVMTAGSFPCLGTTC